MRVALVLLVAVAAAAWTYFGLERMGRRGLPALLCRAVAWGALGVLLLNVGCPRPPAERTPIVLLDNSLSMAAAGGQWGAARDSAARLGEVRRFGDERAAGDSMPARGRSLLLPALTAAAASDRPVVIVTDGEIEDAADLPPDLLERAAVRGFPRAPVADRAITAITGPARVTAGDSIVLDLELRAIGSAAGDTVAVEVADGTRRLARRTVRVDSANPARLRLAAPSTGLPAGDHLLRVAIVGASDAEPRTDARLHLVSIAETPGVVLVASPGDWDARALFRALRDVAQLPVKGYVRLEVDRWRSMTDLTPASADAVQRAARGADLLIVKGAAGPFATGARARGIWSWSSGENGETLIPGDWYLAATETSPVAGAFLGLPVDSFAPATRITPIQPAPGDWIGLEGVLNRRGAPRPVVVGRDDGRVRRVTVAADGLWRWAFRGGSSEQAYRAWVAATTSWLLGGADTARGVARPLRPVVQSGRPIVFEWSGGGVPRDVAISWNGGERPRADTLRFDGGGRAQAWLAPGEYRYRLGEGGAGMVAVEAYSDELLPRAVTLGPREARTPRAPGRSSAREWIWLFGLAVLALSGEWAWRRRVGLR